MESVLIAVVVDVIIFLGLNYKTYMSTSNLYVSSQIYVYLIH